MVEMPVFVVGAVPAFPRIGRGILTVAVVRGSAGPQAVDRELDAFAFDAAIHQGADSAVADGQSVSLPGIGIGPGRPFLARAAQPAAGRTVEPDPAGPCGRSAHGGGARHQVPIHERMYWNLLSIVHGPFFGPRAQNLTVQWTLSEMAPPCRSSDSADRGAEICRAGVPKDAGCGSCRCFFSSQNPGCRYSPRSFQYGSMSMTRPVRRASSIPRQSSVARTPSSSGVGGGSPCSMLATTSRAMGISAPP